MFINEIFNLPWPKDGEGNVFSLFVYSLGREEGGGGYPSFWSLVLSKRYPSTWYFFWGRGYLGLWSLVLFGEGSTQSSVSGPFLGIPRLGWGNSQPGYGYLLHRTRVVVWPAWYASGLHSCRRNFLFEDVCSWWHERFRIHKTGFRIPKIGLLIKLITFYIWNIYNFSLAKLKRKRRKHARKRRSVHQPLQCLQ